jgi:hypothetical protein
MEKEPTRKSCSRYLQLAIEDELKEYVELLEKIANNPHKYQKINTQIADDPNGDPYVIMHYIDFINEEEKTKKKFAFSGKILRVPRDLKEFDTLMESSWNKEITISFIEDFKHHEKDFFYLYKLMIYFTSNEKKPVEKSQQGV